MWILGTGDQGVEMTSHLDSVVQQQVDAYLHVNQQSWLIGMTETVKDRT
jgi:IS30 family transposase